MTATITDSALRIEPGPDSVRIWSAQIFGGAEPHTLREFVARAFSVDEVEGIELQPSAAFGRIRYRARSSPSAIWKKLGRALRDAVRAGSTNGKNGSPKPAPEPLQVGSVYLDGPASAHVKITRVGSTLTTWHVKKRSERSLHLFHPVLRGNREVQFRLEEELAATYGVESFSASSLSGTLTIRFDSNLLSDARVALLLEKAWPRLLAGLSPPPSRKRFAAATGVLGLAFTGQFLLPAVRPFAVLGAAVYSSPNALAAVRDLKRGTIGLPALYTTGLVFMLYTGMPFGAGVFATLMQLWPNLAYQTLVRSQRRLFAEQRKRPAWARLRRADGAEVEAHLDDVQRDDHVLVRRGEVVPVDGLVLEGLAAVVDPAAFGSRIRDLSHGDSVLAGSVLRDGSLTVRAQRSAAGTLAEVLDAWLPHGLIQDLPCALEVERIANRNARPALALSLANLFFTRTLPLSQALIRPDYITAPRLAVQLSTLQAVAEGFAVGVLSKRPAALEHLAKADVFVIDDSIDLARQLLAVSGIETAHGVTKDLLLQYALSAQQQTGLDQSRALATAAQAAGAQPLATPVARFAGVSRYRDAAGRAIEVVSEPYLRANKIHVPKRFAARAAAGALWVLRDGELVGKLEFARKGQVLGLQLVAAIKAQAPRARILYASSATDADAQALAASVGIDAVNAGLTAVQKAHLIRETPRTTVWIGDGTQPDVREAIQASSASVSLAQLRHAHDDAADVLLGEDGVEQLSVVLGLARAHAARLARDYRTVYSMNMLGIAGAVVGRLTSLQVGLLSNAGTWWIYARHARALDTLAAEAQATRQRLTLALHP